MASITELEWVTIRTTLPVYPYPPLADRQSFRTARLLCRVPTPQDLGDYHHLRSQPEVMQWTLQGTVDKDLEHTKKILFARFGEGEGEYLDWAICNGETGEFLGIGGSHRRIGEVGWPVLGYMFKPSAWGKGYATEFLKGFLEAWWQLPRQLVDVKVDKDFVFGEGELKTEVISAITDSKNQSSMRVLDKCGLELAKVFVDPANPHAGIGEEASKEGKEHEGVDGGQAPVHAFAAKRAMADSKITA